MLLSHSALFWLDLLGVATFATAGVLVAARHRLDLFGALAVAFICSLGGGTLRDVLLGQTPVFWVRNPLPGHVALGFALVTFYTMRFFAFPTRLLQILDALGLGVFAVLGAAKTLDLEVSPLIAAPMGLISGAAGGAIRDMLCGEVPTILRAEVYATAALLGAGTFCILEKAGAPREIGLFAGVALTFCLRIGAIRNQWQLPIARAKGE